MARVVIFGAGGFIGIPLCEELVRRGHEVTAVDKWYFEKYPSVGNIVRMDIRDLGDLALSPDWSVIDLAGLSNDATAEIDPSLTVAINGDGARHLAYVAKKAGVRRYIYSSSASVYGHGNKMYLTENDEVAPLTEYAKSKVGVEKYLNLLAGEDFEPVILRNATVFGVAPRMRFDLAINVMTMRAWKDKRILIMGGGRQMRPFVHVSDVVRVFCEMLERPADQVAGKTFNVGSDVMNFSISQIAGLIKQQFRDAEIISVPDDTDLRTYHLSFKKLRDIGIECNFGIEAGIKEVRDALDAGTINADDPTTITLKWYQELMAWEKRLANIRLDGRIL